MKQLFRLVKVLFSIYVVYLLIGLGLGYFGIINSIPLAPGWKIKTPNYAKEQTQVDFEQPIVYYENDSLKTLFIEEHQGALRKRNTSHHLKETVSVRINYEEINFEVPIIRAHSIETDVYPLPNKAICVSDIEGNFDGFIRFLKGNKVINDNLEWSYGKGHLVLLGDYFDRGKYVNECLWLIYKLEQEAERVGGKVHFILGNHETMNIIGAYDHSLFKYVNGKFFANATFMDFEYENWYSKQTELGRWFRTKNSIEKMGGLVLVHGGISPDLVKSGLTLEQINSGIRKGLDKNPKEHSETEALLLRNNGPLWYRGLAKEEITNEQIDTVLAYFNSSKIIIGHTVFNQIKTLYGSKVIDIDVNHSENREILGLLIEDNTLYEINDNGNMRKLTSYNSVN